jgi:hypothetical protein
MSVSTPAVLDANVSAANDISEAAYPNNPLIDPALSELARLVDAVADFHAFTSGERSEALEIARGDPVNALRCFRGLVSRSRRSRHLADPWRNHPTAEHRKSGRPTRGGRTTLNYPATTHSYSIRPMPHLDDTGRTAIADQILARYLAGEEIAVIAQDYQISNVTAYALLVSCREETWKDIAVARALSRYAAAERELDTVRRRLEAANDPLELGKVRELIRLSEAQMKGASWQLEKLYRRLFGQDVPQTGSGMIQINIGINREPQTYEGEAHAG